MTFALIGLVAFTTSFVLWFLRAVFARELRWKFYALRDDLREAAFQDRELLSKQEFWQLDRSLTTYCKYLDDLSLWTIVPFAMFANSRDLRRRTKRLQASLALPTNSALQGVYDRSIQLLAGQLFLRHLIVLPLSVSALVLWVAFRTPAHRLARRFLGPALVSPPVGSRSASGVADAPA